MNEGTTTQEANIYEVWWRAYGDNRHAYVRAENEERAKEIAQELLTRETKITEIFRVDESRITPQSITLNFANTSEYELFG